MPYLGCEKKMDILSVWYRHKVRLSLPPGRKAGWWCTCDGGALTDLDLHLWDEEGAGAAAHPSRAPVPETLSLHSCHLAFQGAWSFLTESGHIFLPNYMSFQPASDKTLVHLCVSMVCELTVGRRGYVRQLARRKPGLSSLSAKPWSSDPFVAISVVIFFVFYFRREERSPNAKSCGVWESGQPNARCSPEMPWNWLSAGRGHACCWPGVIFLPQRVKRKPSDRLCLAQEFLSVSMLEDCSGCP